MKAISKDELIDLGNSVLIIDIRSYRSLDPGFIKGSIFIDPEDASHIAFLQNNFSKKPIVAVVDEAINNNTYQKLTAANIDVQGAYTFNINDWNKSKEIDLVISIDAYEFQLDIKHEKKITIIDTRKDIYFDEAHVEEAINFSIQSIWEEAEDELEKKEKIYIYSQNGNSSLTAATILKRKGFELVKNIENGMKDISTYPDFPIKKRKTIK